MKRLNSKSKIVRVILLLLEKGDKMRMKERTTAVLLIAMFMISTLVMAMPVMAASDYPSIDGVVGAGEWDGALEIQVASSMGLVRVLPTFKYLYVLFEVVDATDARLGQPVGNDKLSLNINPTDGATYGKPYDIIFETGTDPNAWDGPTCGLTDGYETNWVVRGVQELSLPKDLKTMTIYNYTSGIRTTEWMIPLRTIVLRWEDTLYLGGNCDIDIIGSGSSSYRFPDTLQWAEESTYVDYTYPPKPKPRLHGGPTYFDGVSMGLLFKTPHKLIVVDLKDAPHDDGHYPVVINILAEDGTLAYTRTFLVRPLARYLVLYLHESVFPDDYTVSAYCPTGPLPYLVASRAGIERSG